MQVETMRAIMQERQSLSVWMNEVAEMLDCDLADGDDLLEEQLAVMVRYRDILNARLERTALSLG